MIVILGLSLIAGLSAAPLGIQTDPLSNGVPSSGSLNTAVSPWNLSSEGIQSFVDFQRKGLEATVLLIGPASWQQSLSSVPADQVSCFFTASMEPTNAEKFQNITNIEEVRPILQQSCPNGYDKIYEFLVLVNSTLAQLPAKLLSSFEQFGKKIDTLQASSQFITGQSGSSSSLARSSAIFDAFQTFLDSLKDLSDVDKQQIVQVLPKLKAFITGEDRIDRQDKDFQEQMLRNFNLTFILYSANSVRTTLKTSISSLKKSLKAVVNDYLAENRDVVNQATQVLGFDISSKLSGNGSSGMNNVFGVDVDGLDEEQNTGLQIAGSSLQNSNQFANQALQQPI